VVNEARAGIEAPRNPQTLPWLSLNVKGIRGNKGTAHAEAMKAPGEPGHEDPEIIEPYEGLLADRLNGSHSI